MFEGKTVFDILRLGGPTMYVLFTRRIESFTDDMQMCASELLCLLEEK